MSQQAYIKLVEASVVQSITLDELKTQLIHYKEQLAQTGSQLEWSYAEAAFPYTIEEKPEGEGQWFYLKGSDPLYRYIAFGINQDETSTIQVMLLKGSTIGDKSKGNEFCKYLGKVYKAEVTLFNGRTMYFNPRK